LPSLVGEKQGEKGVTTGLSELGWELEARVSTGGSLAVAGWLGIEGRM
jgi:hypothetical protein